MMDQIYSSEDGAWSVLIRDEVIARVLDLTTASRRHETGGILIGRYEDDGRLAVIEIATDRPRGSIFSAFTFGRGSKDLARRLEEEWRLGRHYLGEWHSHPGGSPEPSNRDRDTMMGIAGNAKYDCSAPVLLIMGEDRHKAPDWSVNVFPAGTYGYALRR